MSGKSLGHQREELGDGRVQGELVVGGVKESFDGFGSECAGELLGEPGSGGAKRECSVDSEAAPGGCGNNAVPAGA